MFSRRVGKAKWIPAFAGMTAERTLGMTAERTLGITEELTDGFAEPVPGS
jgi:hypothetical protein